MRSKVDDFLIGHLSQRRAALAEDIAHFNLNGLAAAQAELLDVENKLKSIDPTILTLAEEKALADEQVALQAAQAAQALLQSERAALKNRSPESIEPENAET